jgi:hypothetical protein
VGQLVGHHVGDPGELGLGDGIGVDEQERLPEGDGPEVLHGAGGEVRQGDQVALVARVGDRVVVGEPAQAEGPELQRVGGEVLLPRHVDHSQRGAVDVDRLGRHQRSDHERHQVGAHGDGVGEADRHPAVAGRLTADLAGVGDGQQVLCHHQRDREHGLEVGLVPAREGEAGVRRLHLGGADDPLDAVVVGEGAPVEPLELVVEDPPERQVDRRLPGGQLAGQGEREALAREGDLGLDAALRPLDPRLVDGQVGGVEHHRGGRFEHLDGDVLRAPERGCGQVGLDPQLVAPGHDVAGQAVLAAAGGCGGGCVVHGGPRRSRRVGRRRAYPGGRTDLPR